MQSRVRAYYLTSDSAPTIDEFQIAAIAEATDIVEVAGQALLQYQFDGMAVVTAMQPVALISAVTIYEQILVSKYILRQEG